LGLFISRELGSRHGGRIWLDSHLGRGSTFYFTLPVFSLARYCSHIFNAPNLDAGSVTLITVDVVEVEGSVPADLLREIRQILERCIHAGQDALLPSTSDEDSEMTFFIVACTDARGFALIASRILRDLQNFDKASQLHPVISSTMLPVPLGQSREEQIRELIARILEYLLPIHRLIETPLGTYPSRPSPLPSIGRLRSSGPQIARGRLWIANRTATYNLLMHLPWLSLQANQSNVSDSEQSHRITTLTLRSVIRPDTIDVPLMPQNKTVLCIDDNQDLLECEKAFLESFGYTVLTASSGKKGLDLASVHSVDVVIVDYVMPEMNGQEVAIEMKRLRPHAPIIMLSGTADVPEQSLKSADVFITKSLLASQLLPAIARLQADLFDRHAGQD
jgi:CheY-like chemotaxis protein